MKVLTAKIKNFKNLDEVDLPLNGESVYLVGPNESGKSSVLQAIWGTLTGNDLPPEPIKEGEENSTVELSIGEEDGVEYEIKMTFTEGRKTGRLTMKTSEGETYQSPRSMLNSIVGNISFDPFDFLRLSARDQVQFLCDALGVDILAIENEYKEAYEMRRDVGRELKLKKGVIEELEKKNPAIIEAVVAEIEPLDFEELQEEHKKILNRNRLVSEAQAKIDSRKAATKSLQEGITNNQRRIIALQEEIRALELESKTKVKEIENFSSEIETLNKWIEEHPAIDPETVSKKMSECMAHNRLYDDSRRYVEEREAEKKVQLRYNELDLECKRLIDAKKELLQGAALGIDGLEIADEGIMYNGLPLSPEQQNTAKLIEIGIRISMAINPNMRIVKIKDGSMLDRKTLTEVQGLLKDFDFQAFVEIVDFDGEDLKILLEEEFNK